MVAIDGVDGAGKTMFADALAHHLEGLGQVVVRTGIDSFHNPRAIRYARGKDSPEGFFRDSYDLDALRTWLLFPARIGMPFKTAVFDHRTDRKVAVNPLVVPLPAVLVFDGAVSQSARTARRVGPVRLPRRAVRGRALRGWPSATERSRPRCRRATAAIARGRSSTSGVPAAAQRRCRG